MRIVVTGGCGFIGSNLIHYLLHHHPNLELLNVDALTYAGDPSNLRGIEKNERYHFCHLDITDRAELQKALDEFRPDGIFHLAAESHVDNSIDAPAQFISTNIVGTYNLLEVARSLWGNGSEKRFLHVSTDEVYGSLGEEGLFTESMQYLPNSPYSASKAGSDHLVRAWCHTYDMNVVTTNCSNNFGPRQHREKLIPTVISSALEGKPIPIYGDGKNIRDWLYVEDHCEALNKVFSHGKKGETYLIGGHNEWTNLDLVTLICEILDEVVGEGPSGSYRSLITFVKDRPGHDQRYAIDPTKIERELGWKTTSDFKESLQNTIHWYRDLLTE